MESSVSPSKPEQMGRIEIRVAHTAADSALIAELFDKVWDVKSMVSPEIMTASLHNGGYGSVIYMGSGDTRRVVGAAFALVGRALPGLIGPNLHSHATGVLPEFVGKGIGEMIKRHQWDWAKENGFEALRVQFLLDTLKNTGLELINIMGAKLCYPENHIRRQL